MPQEPNQTKFRVSTIQELVNFGFSPYADAQTVQDNINILLVFKFIIKNKLDEGYDKIYLMLPRFECTSCGKRMDDEDY